MAGINVKNLAFEYNSGFNLLMPSAAFETNTSYSVIGPNGAGKSTFFKILVKSLDGYAGEIELFNQKLKKISISQLRQILGYCGSEKILNLNFTVYEYVTLGFFLQTGMLGFLSQKQKDRASYLLNLFQLFDLRNRSLFQLSAGELKRIRLCKALITVPKILVIDEPEDHLDLFHLHQAFENIKTLYSEKKEHILIFSTHNINVASKFSENMLILQNGRVLYKGKTQNGITEENIEKIYRYKGKVIPWNDNKKRFVF